MFTSNRNHPRWPTLWQNGKSGGQTVAQQGHYVFLLFFFISPSEESSVLFDIRPTCSSDEHKSGVECVRGPSLIVCSALSDPQYPASTRGRTHTDSCSQVVSERHAIAFSSLTHAGLNIVHN